MISKFRQLIARHAINYHGWQTDRKIIVIESDDWGSSCMPSADTFRNLISKGIRVDKCPYTSYDSLASEKDLNDLFSVLKEFQDKNGFHPVITANTLMMNPDFQRIEKSGFTSYYGEPFTETLKRYPEHARSFSLWRQGISESLFFPQFHGREHLNVNFWMKTLQRSDSVNRTVYEDEMFWPGSAEEERGGLSIRAAFDAEDLNDVEHHREVIIDGLQQFENLFGYKSESFIAPNFVYHPSLNETLYENGVQYLQGMKYQKLPIEGNTKRDMLRRFHGRKNEWGQLSLIRNCVFEPSQHPEKHDTVGHCLEGVENAFFWKKPAVITAHRLNFIGYIDPGNRERNLKLFRELLDQTLKKWPDAEFMTSDELGKFIKSSVD